MPGSDAHQQDTGSADATPAPEEQPAAPATQQPTVVPDEAQNPDQYLNWSSRSRDPKDTQKK